jgi:transposase-like protein
MRRPAGRKQVQMLVAYGIRRDGSRHLLAFLRSQGESQADWEALLEDLYRRGLEGQALGLILTDGCALAWRRRFARSIRECGISAAGCTRCGTF